MPNPHLNFFRPYRDVTHEDELTRAALVVMRLLPLAHAEFLRLVDPGLSATALPSVAFDTQIGGLHPELAGRLSAGEQPLGGSLEVISVFLTPSDEPRPIRVQPSSRRPRFDGALRYGDELVVVVESKLGADADSWQAENIPLGSLADHCSLRPDGALVPWHDLLEAWMRLDELALLGPTEKTVLADFFDLAGEHFAELLPFKTLARAGDNDTRIQRRVHDLLHEATGAELDWDSRWAWWYAYGDWRTFERVALVASFGESLSLELWPAHKKPQAEAIYTGDGISSAVASLDGVEVAGGRIRVTPDLFLRSYAPPKVLNLEVLSPDSQSYMAFWEANASEIHQYDVDAVPLDWLVDERMIGSEQATEVRQELAAKSYLKLMLQPGLSVAITWSWDQAVALDHEKALVPHLRAALSEVFSAFGEQLPAVIKAGEPV